MVFYTVRFETHPGILRRIEVCLLIFPGNVITASAGQVFNWLNGVMITMV
jgi:uncharacterized membrane protein YdjX (TVP38/TMEM64 family)